MTSYICGEVKETHRETFKSFTDFLDELELQCPNRAAFILYDEEFCKEILTFSEWSKLSRNFAKNFQGKVKEKGVIFLLVPTSREFPISFMGLQRLGLNTVLVSTPIQLENAISQVKADALIIAESIFRETPSETIEKIPTVVLVGDGKKYDSLLIKELLLYTDLIKENNDESIILPRVNPEEDLVVFLTSGSSGLPKLVQLSQWSWICQMAAQDGFDGKMFNERQMSYGGGFGTITMAIVKGAGVVYTKFMGVNPTNTKKILKVISLEECAFIMSMGYLLYDMAFFPDELKKISKHVKVLITGGQMLNESVLPKIFECLPKVHILEVYGGTEFGAIFNRIFMKDFPKPVTQVPPFSQITIRNDIGQVVNRGKEGHIWVKSRGCMKRYYNNPKSTKESVQLNGWFKTGDFGMIALDGSPKVFGRRCDEINVATIKIFPAKLEQIIIACEYIEDVLVVGIPDERLGETLCAVVLLKEKYKGNEVETIKKGILDYCKEKIKSNSKIGYISDIEIVVFVDEIPKTYSNKINRLEIRKQAINSLKKTQD